MGRFTEYFGLSHVSDDQHDMFDENMGQAVEQDRQMRASPLSSRWTRKKRLTRSPEKVVYDLIWIRDTVSSLLRIHGMPKNTSISVVPLGKIGQGLSGFADIGTWKQPFIGLDAEVYKDCDSDEVLDVYCGIGLHEASHLNHTREFFLRMKRGTVVRGSLRRLWENLFEDERVDDYVREESRGFAPYIQASKRALFDKQEIGEAIKHWDDENSGLSDIDKVNALIFAFIRCPYLLSNSLKTWTTVSGRCVFDELRDMFPDRVRSEKDVVEYADRLERWYDDLKQEYADQMQQNSQETSESGESGGDQDGESEEGSKQEQSQDATEAGNGSEDSNPSEPSGSSEQASNEATGTGKDPSPEDSQASSDDGTEAEGGPSQDPDGEGSPGGSGDNSSDMQERLNRQAKTDKQDREWSGERDLKQHLSDNSRKLEGMDTPEKVSERLRHAKDSGLESFEKTQEKLEKKVEKWFEERKQEGRFGLPELFRMMQRVDTVTKPLSAAESEQMAKAEAERVELGPEWQPDKSIEPKRAVIVHPQATEEACKKYHNYKQAVQNDIAKMKQVFRFRLGTRTYCETQRKEGRIHRRMLGRATQTSRIFKREYSRRDQGIAICLLLDESGSMSYADITPSSSKASTALKMAVLMAEALKQVPGVELEVYSFTSCGSRDTLFKYLYGGNNPKLEGLANYGSGSQNYDYQAIQVAAEQFKKYTTNENRLMIVLSDGAPCGHFRGLTAFEATKMSVDTVRRQGIKVLQVAIEDYQGSSSIYGNKWVIKFTDIPQLVNEMRKMIVRVVRDATEGR